jgi:hypothetical protein
MKVICDNNSQIIDQNQLSVDIFIKPNRYWVENRIKNDLQIVINEHFDVFNVSRIEQVWDGFILVLEDHKNIGLIKNYECDMDINSLSDYYLVFVIITSHLDKIIYHFSNK